MSAPNACTIRTKKFITNPLLGRRQFVVDVLHPGVAGIAKTEMREKLAKLYKVSDATLIVLFGFKLSFGGGRSTGFGMIYDSTTSQKRFEPRHRLIKVGLAKAKTGARKQRKELKNRLKKLRGLKKAKAAKGSS